MKFWFLRALGLCFAMACSGGEEADGTSGKPAEIARAAEPLAVAADAQAAAPIPARPLGAHLDGNDAEYRPREFLPRKREGKNIELFLRSSPAGASASMDGKSIGTTPTFWSGVVNGQSHEFTFVKAGYAMARYRFVATQSGVVHGTLKPLAKAAAAGKEGGDAGTAAARP